MEIHNCWWKSTIWHRNPQFCMEMDLWRQFTSFLLSETSNSPVKWSSQQGGWVLPLFCASSWCETADCVSPAKILDFFHKSISVGFLPCSTYCTLCTSASAPQHGLLRCGRSHAALCQHSSHTFCTENPSRPSPSYFLSSLLVHSRQRRILW